MPRHLIRATGLVSAFAIATLVPLPLHAGGDTVDVGPVFVFTPDTGAGVAGAGGKTGAGTGATARTGTPSGTGAGIAAKTGAAAGSGTQPAGSAANPAPVPGTSATPAATAIGQTVSPAATNQIVGALTLSLDFCAAISAQEYLVDCLSERFAAVATALPETGDYGDMRTALADASRSLAAVARASPSASLPTGIVRSTSGTPIATTRPLRPVDTADLAASLDAALAIVAETQTVLLRSTTNSDARALDYQRVAAVVGSTKVLLRSS